MSLPARELGTPGRRARPGVPALVRLVVAVIASLLVSGTDAAEADDSIPTAWQVQAGTAGLLTAPPPPEPATICIIDTGVTPTPDLTITARSSTLPGTLDDVTAKPGQPGHGTTVAHFAAAAVNGWGGSGAFPHARISSVRVFPEEGGTDWESYIRAFDRCHRLDGHTKVVVLPLGGQELDRREREELEDRITTARDDLGLNVVVAAGNGGGPVDFPGRFPSAFTVVAHDAAGVLCGFSARGPEADISAPGCGVETAGWDGAQWAVNGTSYAAPIIAGVLAALRSYRPELSPEEAENVVRRSARPGLVPLLDARAALAAVGLAWNELRLPESTVDSARPAEAVVPDPAPEVTDAAAPVLSRWRAQEPRSPTRLRRRVVKLVVRVSRRRGVRQIQVLNRPSSAYVEVRVGQRRLLTKQTRVSLRSTRRARVRVRFVDEMSASGWIFRSMRSAK